MPNAKIALPDGTNISVDGSIEEIERLMRVYSAPTLGKADAVRGEAQHNPNDESEAQADPDEGPSISAIVAKIKECDEAVAIERIVLDSKGLLNRVLLPLFILEKYFPGSPGLTSGDINKITTQLGVPIKTAHASTTLSQTARPFLVADTVRKKGAVVHYRMIRRGVQHFEALLAGKSV